MLELRGLTKRFGGITAVDDCSFAVREHSITGLIGPNGSGKTTVFNLLTGIYQADRGDMVYRGHSLMGLKTHEIALKGIARTFQIIRVFPRMSVLDNLLMAAQQHFGEKWVQSLVRTPAIRRHEREIRDKAGQILGMLNLLPLRDEPAGNLSYGQQKLLEFGSAIISDPALVLLDEPAAGVNRTLLNSLLDKIRKLCEQGTTFLIVEHDMKVVMNLCEWVVVLDHGRAIAAGEPAYIQRHKDVIEAYFGR
ncbi:MAG: ABC transporter ATP-binding protein [Candidatus Methylomirabilia bacterium]